MKNWIENLKKKYKNQKGLTLVELLAVIVILAIVGSIAFVMIGNVIENSKQDSHVANAQQVVSAAKLYDSQNGKFDENNKITSAELHTAGLIDKLINPWNPEDNTYVGTVTKIPGSGTNGVTYQIDLKGDNCTLASATEAQLATGRDACAENN